jgi:hypothetical protein
MALVPLIMIVNLKFVSKSNLRVFSVTVVRGDIDTHASLSGRSGDGSGRLVLEGKVVPLHC